MAFFWNFIRSLARMLVGIAVLVCAAAIPAHFASVNSRTMTAAGTGTQTPQSLARLYLDGVKLSAASLVADSAGGDANLEEKIESLYKKRPLWAVSGGDEPFFEAFYSTLEKPAPRKAAPECVYALLSTQDNRGRLLNFLRQSNSAIVDRILKLRSMNSTLLPPVFTSAGAPLDAAILTTALLAQTGDLSHKFLREFNSTAEQAKGDSAKQEELERFFVAVLALSKDCDWTLLRSAMSNFSSPQQAYDFARTYTGVSQKCGGGAARAKRAMLAGLLMSQDPALCVRYLSGGGEREILDFSRAYCNGEGALRFLLNKNQPIKKRPFWRTESVDRIISPMESRFAPACAKYPGAMLALKVALSILGGYFLARGFFRLFEVRRDTPAWFSPLALARGLLEGVVVATAFFLLVEPEAFTIKINTESPPELRFSFVKNIAKTIGEETMKLETDTATLVAIGLFFVIQLLVYVFCLIRLASIKRLNAPAQLKLKLLENEENLFDLGLYIGLGGTVISLVLITVGIVTASLMAGYTSTLYGILFTALVKIVHVRRYKRKLLLEAQ